MEGSPRGLPRGVVAGAPQGGAALAPYKRFRVAETLKSAELSSADLRSMEGSPRGLPRGEHNAAMIGSQGYYEYLAGHTAGWELNARASLDISRG